MSETVLNIGILAHVDAGKTSITENILFLSGEIKKMGSVDSGNAQTDFLEVEKQRGISVKASYTSFSWNEKQINLIDTPGHVDFSSELDRSIRVMDYAILVISAVEGIQGHTESIWNALKEANIPVLFFINKLDRAGADAQKIISDIKKQLAPSVFQFQTIEHEATNDVRIMQTPESLYENAELIDILANNDDQILERYINEQPIPAEMLSETLKTAISQNRIHPILFGSAKFQLGIKELLDFCTQYFTARFVEETAPFSALVFSITHDKHSHPVVFLKILSGTLKTRDVIENITHAVSEKITRISYVRANKYIDIDIAYAGEIVAVSGLSSVKVGDYIGQVVPENTPLISLSSPLLSVQVKPKQSKDYSALAEALGILSKEDEALAFEWDKEEQELHLKIMGKVQTEILEQILSLRFGIEAEFAPPTIIYKETPTQAGEGFVRYWMPKPCWAILKFKIEPLPIGSGVVYESVVSVNDVHRKYQNEVEQTITNALQQGIKGWEVTDLKITLIEGQDHEVHSRPGDFKVATPMGIMDGLQNTGTTLLEPVLSFKIVADEPLLGSIVGDVTHLRGTFETPDIENGFFTLHGLLPLSTSLDYAVILSSKSSGKAKYSTKLHAYQKCTDEQGVTREYKGISPLDTAKYILKARKAIQ